MAAGPGPSPVRNVGPGELGLALLAFLVLGLAFVAPAFPGTGQVLGGQELVYFRPPLSELRPPDLLVGPSGLLADPVEVFRPDLEWFVEAVRNGHAPLWNPLVGAGHPTLASQQTAPLFPLNAPAYLLPFWSSLGVIAALRIALAALGTYLLGRLVLRLRPGPAAMAAVAFAVGSYFVAWLEHPHGNVYALTPWLLLAVDRVIRRPDPLGVAAVGAATGAALLGGHPQSVIIDGLLVVPFAAWRASVAGRRALGPTAPAGRALAGLVAGGVIGAAAGAVMLVPLVEFLGVSASQTRGGFGGIDPAALATFALPEAWGTAGEEGFPGFGAVNWFERTAYVGVPALLLAVAGLAIGRSGGHRFFLVMALVTAALAVRLPLITWFTDSVPPFSRVTMFRALAMTGFCVAILAGYGLERLLTADAAGRRRAFRVAAAVAATPVAWLVLTRTGALTDLSDAARSLPGVAGTPRTNDGAMLGAVLRWGVFAVLVLAALAGMHRFRAASRVVAALLVLQLVDLAAVNREVHPVVSNDVLADGPTGPLAQAVADQAAGRTVGDDAYLLPNQGLRFGLRDVRVRAQPTIGRVDALVGAYIGAQPRTVDVDHPGAAPLLDAFGVTQVLTGARPADPADPSLQLVAASADDRLYVNQDALPRAYVATSWRTARSPAEAITLTAASATEELANAPVIEGVPPQSGGTPAGTARFILDGAREVILEVDAPAAAHLVLLDAHYPGWTATVDGADAPIRNANGAFRAVPVPVGRSVVSLEYRPVSVFAGLAVSGVAWLVLASLAAWGLLGRRLRAGAARPR